MTGDHSVLRALHWNIHSWTDDTGRPNVDAVTRLIHKTDPDVVSLVEVDETAPLFPHLDGVAGRTGMASVFIPAFAYGHNGGGGWFGNAILTRLPILTVRQHHLLTPPPAYDGTEQSEPRTLLLVRVHAPSGPIWIGSTHLPRCDANARAAALRELRSIVRALPLPWLILGDFNTPAATWLGGDTGLAFHPAPPEPTYPTDDPLEPIDYCIMPRSSNGRADALAEPGSDHLPILGRISSGVQG